MASCAVNEETVMICWFCKKNRHSECMGEIPVASSTSDDGMHDCTFDTTMVKCKCECTN